jgi:uncharacterized membrane protein YjjP (DUF1212 family)
MKAVPALRCERLHQLFETDLAFHEDIYLRPCADMNALQLHSHLLLRAGRLLLEYNESTAGIQRALQSTAKTLTGEGCHVAVSYGGVAVSLAGQSPVTESVSELRYNTAIQSRVHEILARVRCGQLDPQTALTYLETVESDTRRHSRWLAALVLGVAATSLAGLLGADLSAAAGAGLATGLGLLARQQLGRWHSSLLTLPLTAALIGALLGGLIIRLGWTRTPELVLVVPALMVIPGPHVINGLLDLVDNHLPMSLARLGLATGILAASVAGIALGVELTLPDRIAIDRTYAPDRLNLLTDVTLAGIVTCGFAVFYNTPWPQLGMAIAGGMIGHGLRFLALEAGCRLEAATFLGGLAVGIISALISRFRKLPIAVIAFAGAVTMIPGLSLYRALIGALQLSQQGEMADPEVMAETLGNFLQSSLVITGLALGLIIGARTVAALVGVKCPKDPWALGGRILRGYGPNLGILAPWRRGGTGKP